MERLFCEDLMVGDWVYIYNFPNDNPQNSDLYPAKIVSVIDGFPDEDMHSVELTIPKQDGGYDISSRLADTCLPIPLTPEILEKNGFEGTPTGDLYIEMNLYDKYAVEVFPSEGSWLLRITDKTNKYSTGCNKINVYLKYIHELQHALKLCKIDKEIEL